MRWMRYTTCVVLVLLLVVGSYGYRVPKILPLRAAAGTRLLLNRIYFEEEECTGSGSALSPLSASLPATDYRAKHILTILKAGKGDHLKVGVLGVGRSDTGVVLTEAGCREGAGADAGAGAGVTILVGARAGLRGNARPCVDLILAVPRPLRLERLLPVVAQLGVGRLVLVDAQKVEKDYFGSHLFRRPQALRARLVEGLEIADVDCHVPPVLVRRRLHKFLSEELDELFPVDEYTRLFAHPTKISGPVVDSSLSQVLGGGGGDMQRKKKRCVLAVGPEGGWSDGEVELFSGQHGFLPFSAGTRILRTDVAVPVLLGLVRDLFRDEEHG